MRRQNPNESLSHHPRPALPARPTFYPPALPHRPAIPSPRHSAEKTKITVDAPRGCCTIVTNETLCENHGMDIVIDTSALLAVIAGEPERNRIVELTSGHTLIGPAAIPWEVCNAFSAMMKKHRLTLDDAQHGWEAFNAVPIRYVKVDMKNALSLASRENMYAYDAYFLDCASRHAAPLLTLDRKLMRAAQNIGIHLLEV